MFFIDWKLLISRYHLVSDHGECINIYALINVIFFLQHFGFHVKRGAKQCRIFILMILKEIVQNSMRHRNCWFVDSNFHEQWCFLASNLGAKWRSNEDRALHSKFKEILCTFWVGVIRLLRCSVLSLSSMDRNEPFIMYSIKMVGWKRWGSSNECKLIM